MTHTTRRFTSTAFALGLALALAASCSIQHRSQDFACTITADCSGGRSCVAGFCVTGTGDDAGSGVTPGRDGGTIDAPRSHGDAGPPADAETCPSICSSCDLGTHSCDIDCAVGSNRCGAGGPTTGSGGEPMPVACPPGYNCTIECTPQGSCRAITCAGAASCEIQCSAANSCRTVACGSGACDVTCSGQSSCRNVACGESCRCDVDCNAGVQTCTGSVICSQEICKDIIDPGCSSTNDSSCDTCPGDQ